MQIKTYFDSSAIQTNDHVNTNIQKHLKETTSLKLPENQVNEETISYTTWKKTN